MYSIETFQDDGDDDEGDDFEGDNHLKSSSKKVCLIKIYRSKHKAFILIPKIFL